MEKEKHYVHVDEGGALCACALAAGATTDHGKPEEGHITYRLTNSFDGKHTLTKKVVNLRDSEKGV